MAQRLLRSAVALDFRVCAALAGLAAFVVYLRTLAPTVMWYDMGEFTTASYVLGIAHNTGYPLYILLGKLFTLFPVSIIPAAFHDAVRGFDFCKRLVMTLEGFHFNNFESYSANP